MLALLVTFLIATYILGPDLTSRWIQGFVIPRKYVIQNRSEEIARAVLWSVPPFFLSYWTNRKLSWIEPYAGSGDWRIIFQGLYSETYFSHNSDLFFASARSLAHSNLNILYLMYGYLILVAVTLACIMRWYGVVRSWVPWDNWIGRAYRRLLAIVIVPRVSEWHLLLSGMTLVNRDLHVWLDIMTKGDVLYQGLAVDKTLGPDGSLVGVAMKGTHRFRREEYVAKVQQVKDAALANGVEVNPAHKPDPKAYWKEIPGQIFTVMASEIATINVRHAPNTVQPWKESEDIKELLIGIKKLLDAMKSDLKLKKEDPASQKG